MDTIFPERGGAVSDHRSMKILNIIGCGRVGMTLARVWREHGCFKIQDVLNRTSSSAIRAVSFIGGGRVVGDYSEMAEADCVMISVADRSIADCAGQLAKVRCVKNGTIVFHCSGSFPSSLLEELQEQGALIASIHPVKSFAVPELAVTSFAGTYCGVEGDRRPASD